MKRQWQTSFWLCWPALEMANPAPERVVVYGETLQALRDSVTFWLNEHQPQLFATHPTYIDLTKGCAVAHVDALRKIYRPNRYDYFDDNPDLHWRVHHLSPNFTESYGFDDAVAQLVRRLVPEKGPEFVQQLFDGNGKLEPHRIQTHYEVDPDNVNSYLARGWVVTSIDQQADGPNSRVTSYHLAHAEPDAR